MKKPFSIIITIIVIFGLNSCCTKKDCEGDNDVYGFQFSGFSESDLDTVKIIRYGKNTNFTIPYDTIITQPDSRNNVAISENILDKEYEYYI